MSLSSGFGPVKVVRGILVIDRYVLCTRHTEVILKEDQAMDVGLSNELFPFLVIEGVFETKAITVAPADVFDVFRMGQSSDIGGI